jgi:hypothetical protein
MRSRTYESLKRDLRRYVQGQVPGRSFLIAGHRGAGKTALVSRAVDELIFEILDETSKASDRQEFQRSSPPQRPLFVKLYGPSLVVNELPFPGGGEAPRQVGDAKTEKPAESAGVTPPVDAGRQAPEALKQAETSDINMSAPMLDRAHVALVQITIALYRAVATEYAKAFLIHARNQLRSAAGAIEVAGQFALELDRAPEPATLRTFWEEIQRLSSGILWPARVGDSFILRGLADQGIREIVALVTASQAYQVCSGAVKYSQASKGISGREASSEFKGSAALKDFGNKLLGLAAGVGIGVGAAIKTDGAIGALAGVFSGLIGTTVLTWSSKRTAKDERTLDYSFILDRSVQTLERDLPLVIERIREAGLAPVFVVDELDKVTGANAFVAEIIGKLKHLTTDHGFFCFLTDRDYFEQLKRTLHSKPFPSEHTFFSEWLFILYQPKELGNYVRALLRSTASAAEAELDEAARSVLARFLVHRAKLNMVDLMRELSRRSKATGEIKTPSAEVVASLEYRLAATVQLGVEHVLASLASRVNDDEIFAQIAVDILYYPSRAWEQEAAELSLEIEDIVAYSLERLRIEIPNPPRQAKPMRAKQAHAGQAVAEQAEARQAKAKEAKAKEAKAKLLETIGPLDFDVLVKEVRRLAEFLCDFQALKRELPLSLGEDRRAIDIIPPEAPALLRKVGTWRYRFLFDVYGSPVEALTAAPSDGLSAEELIDFFYEFQSTLRTIGLEIGDLVSLDMLPSTMAPEAIISAIGRLHARPGSGGDAEILLLRSFVKSVVERGPGLARLTGLAVQVLAEADLQHPKDTLPVLKALARYIDFREAFAAPESAASMIPFSFSVPQPGANRQSLVSWREGLETVRRSSKAWPIDTMRANVVAAWNRWADRLREVTIPRSDRMSWNIDHSELVIAAAGQVPSSVFRANFRAMTFADWSRLFLRSFEPIAREDGVQPPFWVIVAALGALGFGRESLTSVIELFRRDWIGTETYPADDDLANELVRNARRSTPGAILVMLESGSLADEPVRPLDVPILAVRVSDLSVYASVLDRLAGLGIIAAVIRESETDEVGLARVTSNPPEAPQA